MKHPVLLIGLLAAISCTAVPVIDDGGGSDPVSEASFTLEFTPGVTDWGGFRRTASAAFCLTAGDPALTYTLSYAVDGGVPASKKLFTGESVTLRFSPDLALGEHSFSGTLSADGVSLPVQGTFWIKGESLTKADFRLRGVKEDYDLSGEVLTPPNEEGTVEISYNPEDTFVAVSADVSDETVAVLDTSLAEYTRGRVVFPLRVLSAGVTGVTLSLANGDEVLERTFTLDTRGAEILYVTDVTLPEDFSIEVGERRTVTLGATPEGAPDRDIVFAESSDPGVLEIESFDGLTLALNARYTGEAALTVKVGEVERTFGITVGGTVVTGIFWDSALDAPFTRGEQRVVTVYPEPLEAWDAGEFTLSAPQEFSLESLGDHRYLLTAKTFTKGVSLEAGVEHYRDSRTLVCSETLETPASVDVLWDSSVTVTVGGVYKGIEVESDNANAEVHVCSGGFVVKNALKSTSPVTACITVRTTFDGLEKTIPVTLKAASGKFTVSYSVVSGDSPSYQFTLSNQTASDVDLSAFAMYVMRPDAAGAAYSEAKQALSSGSSPADLYGTVKGAYGTTARFFNVLYDSGNRTTFKVKFGDSTVPAFSSRTFTYVLGSSHLDTVTGSLALTPAANVVVGVCRYGSAEVWF